MVSLKKNALFMAPMVDLSHVAYRQLVRELGGCDIFYSEMLNSRMVPSENPDKSVYLKSVRREDLVFQLLGSDPSKMGIAASLLDRLSPFGIDVNMGCWLKKVTVHGWGVALMKDMLNAEKVLSTVRASTKLPVSAKIRIGYEPDFEYLKDFVSMLEGAGADYIVLHARTVPDGLNKPARWEFIGRVKDHAGVPVIGNGGITTAEDAVRMFELSACDGVMIGRQAIRTPWIFRDIKSLLAGEEKPAPPAIDEVILRLLDLLDEYLPEDVAIKRFRTAIAWLAENFQFGHYLAKEACRAKDTNQARTKVNSIFASGIS